MKYQNEETLFLKIKNQGNILIANFVDYLIYTGILVYNTTTRPDLQFYANLLSWFMSNPTKIHFQAVKKVLRYLKGTTYFGI